MKQLSAEGQRMLKAYKEDRESLERKHAGDHKYAQMLEKLTKIGR